MDIEYKFLKEIDCKQGAVRSVRFSGKEAAIRLFMYLYESNTYVLTRGFLF